MRPTEFNLRVLIPLAAGSALFALGCSSADPEEEESEELKAASDYCEEWKSCNESTFDDEYDSVSSCSRVLEAHMTAQTVDYEETESKACASAFAAYSDCTRKQLTCDAFPDWDDAEDREDYSDWREDVRDSCEDEFDDYFDACDLGPVSTYDDYYY